jgi:hypothetical protein
MGQLAPQQSGRAEVGSGSKPECLPNARMSASTSCGHPSHRLWPASCPLGDLSRCSKVPDKTLRYSITSSAVESSVGGTVRPSSLAVCTLITSSNLLDCMTGRSAGLAPLRMRPT